LHLTAGEAPDLYAAAVCVQSDAGKTSLRQCSVKALSQRVGIHVAPASPKKDQVARAEQEGRFRSRISPVT
jgi:hypothetical protein